MKSVPLSNPSNGVTLGQNKPAKKKTKSSKQTKKAAVMKILHNLTKEQQAAILALIAKQN